MNNPNPLCDPIKTTQAAVFVGADRALAFRQFPLPPLSAHEALVRIECCTLCGSDLHTLTGKRAEAVPSILGHEILGEVVAVGTPPLPDLNHQPLRPGDRVTWSTSVSCGKCERCVAGLPQKCERLAKYGHERAEGRTALSGGLAEHLLLRAGSAVVKLPREIPAAVLCPVNCATATICAALRTAGSVANKRVLIFGAGMLGLTAAALAATSGAASVTICDRDERRLKRALQFGVDRTVVWTDDDAEPAGRWRGGSEFDVILELSGNPDAAETSFRLAATAAKIIFVGSVMKSRGIVVDPEQVVRRWISLHGVHNYAPQDLQTAVNFLLSSHQRFPFAELVEQSFSLSAINEAVAVAVRDRPVRIAIFPDPEGEADADR